MTAERGSLAFLEYRRPVHLEDRLIGILVFLAVAHVGGRGRGTGKVEALDSLEDVWNSRVYGPASSKTRCSSTGRNDRSSSQLPFPLASCAIDVLRHEQLY